MRAIVISRILIAVYLAIASSLAPSVGQEIIDPAALPKNSFAWNQEERELGFLHLDVVFKTRDVPSGETVHELPGGLPITAFAEEGEEKDTRVLSTDAPNLAKRVEFPIRKFSRYCAYTLLAVVFIF